MGELKLLDGYTPSDLGLDGYESYRTHPVTGHPIQLEVIEYMAMSKARFVAACVPTGVGKSLIAMSLAKLKSKRTAILTATNGLEAQYMKDMSEYGLANVHGKAKYTCSYKPRGVVEFDCHSGAIAGCKHANGGGCTYEIYRDESRVADQVITNYDYWFNINPYGGIKRQREEEIAEYGPNPIQILVCDEAHEADRKLSDFLSVRVYEREIENSVDVKKFGEDTREWSKLASERKKELEEELGELKEEIAIGGRRKDLDEYHKKEKLLRKFERLATIDKDWVVEKRVGTQWGRMWAFDVKWPGRYSEQYLWVGTPKVILMSATLRPHHLRRLGVSKDNFEFREWEPIFQKSRCPVYYLPPKRDDKEIRITAKTSEQDLKLWVAHIDDMCEQRLDRRILIVTSSYKYQQFFLTHSRHSKYMVANNADDPDTPTAQVAYEKFISTPPPVILCSPSFGTGWDLKGDRCEFLVISKVPLKPPPSTSKLASARVEQDREYYDSETMSDVVQARGRPWRSEDDRAEVVISDGAWSWWGWTHKHLAPVGFVEGVRRVVELPKRPEKLKENL